MTALRTQELIQMAVKDEVTGEAFYKALAGSAKDGAVKTKLLEIADQEKHHAARFGDMLKTLKEYKATEEYSGQYDNYVSALLSNRAFPSPEKAAEKARTMPLKEGVEMAERMEKDTLLFYGEMKNFIPKDHVIFVDEIMNEERSHLTELTKLAKGI